MDAICINTPLGLLKLTADEQKLLSVQYHHDQDAPVSPHTSNPVLTEAEKQLSAYFDGKLKKFTLPLAPRGTPFQLRVWEALQAIPYGTTTTYLELSEMLGNTNAIRAVGRANGQNPVAIIIPCHRVIGSDNKLVGYAGGIERKHKLLQHEGALLL